MPTLTGSTKDFRPQSLGSTAELIFTPFGPAITTSGSVLVGKPIVVAAAPDGSFSVDLVSYSGTNPNTAYHLRIQWLDSFNSCEDIPWPVIVTGDGLLTNMFGVPTGTGFTVKGDKGDSGDVVSQALLDAITARLPVPGNDRTFGVVDLNENILLGTTEDGGTIIQDGTAYASEGFQLVTEDGYILFDTESDTERSGGTAVPIDTLHVFICLGQSNMSGRALILVGNAKNPRIFQFGATRNVFEPATIPLDMHDSSTGLSPATTFAENYLKTQPPNVGVLLIPAAHGSTGFTLSPETLTWAVGAASSPAYDLPALAVAQTLAAIEAARALGYVVDVMGALFHQGENNSSTSQATYEGFLAALISFVRSSVGKPNLAFVVGQMSLEGIDLSPGRQGIDRAHSGTPARVAYTGFAPSLRGATNEGDTTHFNKAGIEFLGRTYLAGYWQAIGNTPTAPPEPPVRVSATKTETTVTLAWAAPPANLTKTETFDLGTGATTYTWLSAPSHATGYRVDTKTGTGPWVTASRAWAMALTETVTVSAGVTQVRVTALNGAAESTPVTTTALGA